MPAIGRSIEMQQRYIEHHAAKHSRGDTSCDLCSAVLRQETASLYPQLHCEDIQLEDKHFALVINDYPYFTYDGQEVLAHHMLVPRQHMGSPRAVLLDNTFSKAKLEAMRSIELLTDGYYNATLTRSSSRPSSSVQAHDNTHYFHFGHPVTEQHFYVATRQNDVRFAK